MSKEVIIFFEYHQGEIHIILVVPAHGNQAKTQYVKDAIAVLDEFFPEIEQLGDTEDGEDDE